MNNANQDHTKNSAAHGDKSKIAGNDKFDPVFYLFMIFYKSRIIEGFYC